MVTSAQEFVTTVVELASGYTGYLPQPGTQVESDATVAPGELVQVAPDTHVMADRIPSASQVDAFTDTMGGVLAALRELPTVGGRALPPDAVAELLPYAHDPSLAQVRLPRAFTKGAEVHIDTPVAGDEHWAGQEAAWRQAPTLTTLALGELAASFVPAAREAAVEGQTDPLHVRAARFLIKRANGGSQVRVESIRGRAKAYVEARPEREAARSMRAVASELAFNGRALATVRADRQRATQNAADDRSWAQYADAERRASRAKPVNY